MWTLLAQGSLPGEAARMMPPPPSFSGLKQAVSPSGMPVEQMFWDGVSQVNYVAAGLLIGVGLVYLLYGWKVFKVLVLVNAAVIGAVLGAWVDMKTGVGWWVSPIGAIVLAVLAWPLLRYAVCVMGGLAGALLGAFVARSIGQTGPIVAAAAAIGLVSLGLLAFIVFRGIVVSFTSIQGSLMTVAGVIGGLAKFQNMSDAIRAGLLARHYLLPVMVMIPALIGFVYQMHRGDGEKT